MAVNIANGNITTTIIFAICFLWMYDAVSEVDTSVIWKSLVGYQELIMAMEYVGRERGYGIYFFAVGTFRDRNHYLRFLESQDIAKAHFESRYLESSNQFLL
jgi:hypothetical protein